MKKAQLTQATELGKQAFANGIKRVPAWDRDLLNLLAGRSIGAAPKGEASNTQIFKAWTSGWDTANLKAVASL